MNKVYIMKFSENLQNLRKQQQLSQEQLADQLGVSRQSVSKWESGDSYPETDKLITLCELFHCSMDELVMGEIATKVEPTPSPDQHKILRLYDSLMNKFSIGIAAGVGIILLGVTMLLSIQGLGEYGAGQIGYYETAGLVALLLSTIAGVPFFIIYGMKLTNFKAKYPKIEARYPESEVERQNGKFIISITIGVMLIILGITVMILANGMHLFSSDSAIPAALLMMFVTISVPIFIFAGIRHQKYNLDNYNRTESPVHQKNEILIGKICGVIMLSMTIIFLSLGFIGDLWEICWLVFPIGGIGCGIVGTILGPDHHN